MGRESQHGGRCAARPGVYRDRVPKNRNVFSSLLSRTASRAVHGLWRHAQRAGAVSAERPGPYAFRGIGEGTRLAFPQGTLFGTEWIELGACCVIGAEVTLTAGMMPGLDLGPDTVLRLGDGVVLGRGSHVVADGAGAGVTIGNDVFCGPYVYITSTNHSYDDPHQPIGRQWPRSAPVEIGAGSWLGTGAVVLPGARLGRNTVVAAGSVVRGEVPDHAVVAGAPAKVVRRWDPREGWLPPLRTPPPVPLPEGVTPGQLAAPAGLEIPEPGTPGPETAGAEAGRLEGAAGHGPVPSPPADRTGSTDGMRTP
ncbi:transferase hexapeptide (six repeat-containing protein) [Streptomyces pini]|uniref:Transferase hexapeptide (Six repeat-containing protein) n=1 Tax=Streptomyces pini TaxID=1520580 RepID=A0A1I3X7Z9_9ACTN|nr:transferase hexapeptide (six repeat-containing protein) [Streptomyces pini]